MKIKPEVILLCGVPTSGKSSWCKNNTNFTIISSDNIIENYAENIGSTYNKVFDDYIKDAISLMLQQLKHAVENNKNIIVDQTHLTPKVRKRKLKMIPDHYEKIAVYFEISKEEMLKRNHNEDRTKIVPVHVLESMHDSYTRPCISEGFSEVLNGHLFNCPLTDDFSLQTPYNTTVQ
jgi:predicted kinase